MIIYNKNSNQLIHKYIHKIILTVLIIIYYNHKPTPDVLNSFNEICRQKAKTSEINYM